ncbi:MAG TPA: YoaK family protein [Oligoflexus sp.]|uniref:YoaK family protein n=1 Tax=Oligoflexus sp. TaxID=1971216 RepID=UPI002D7FED84|nr:YoaK family protein [Oligoflexus sp.]HET9240787.1 YoaK family protein [Oligoflexus sp.]
MPNRPLHYKVLRHARLFIKRFHENLELGVLLAFIAGIVNTVGFLQFGAFVSHMSGHASRSAVEYAEGNSSAALVFLLELVFFVAGAFTTAFLLQGHTVTERRVKFTGPVVLEALCILSFLLLTEFRGLFWLNLDQISLTTLILAYAMGLQNAMLRHTSGTIIRTTHITGVVTDIGIELGAACHSAKQALLRERAITAGIDAFWERLGVGRFTFHILLVFAFFLGSVVGTLGYIHALTRILILPVLLLLGLALREHRRALPAAR